MPPRRQATSRALPGGALETMFPLDQTLDNTLATPLRTPPAPRRQTRRRQPNGEDNTGADPSPMRTRRSQHQLPPTPVAPPHSELDPEPSPASRRPRRRTAATNQVASSSRTTLEDMPPGISFGNIFFLALTRRAIAASEPSERPRDLFDSDYENDNTGNQQSQRRVRFADDAQNLFSSPPESTSGRGSPSFSTPSRSPIFIPSPFYLYNSTYDSRVQDHVSNQSLARSALGIESRWLGHPFGTRLMAAARTLPISSCACPG
ncbi:hypothetical protein R3P38DRAFT_2786872 [Favolaschia claudopus]|uniref:Uncharacterized protein n=1 Tax=Favolaschia claudopus TaxID=2862362 RepID=A0AAW0APX6_9AGAR